MRIDEITTRKPKPPLTPAQARVNALRLNVERSKDQLNAEILRQRQQRDNDRKRKELKARHNAQLSDRFMS